MLICRSFRLHSYNNLFATNVIPSLKLTPRKSAPTAALPRELFYSNACEKWVAPTPVWCSRQSIFTKRIRRKPPRSWLDCLFLFPRFRSLVSLYLYLCGRVLYYVVKRNDPCLTRSRTFPERKEGYEDARLAAVAAAGTTRWARHHFKRRVSKSIRAFVGHRHQLCDCALACRWKRFAGCGVRHV